MDLENIPIEKQVNLILLSKVLKNYLDLKKKTNLSLYQIHRILQNQDEILEEWKEKNKKITKTPNYTVAVEKLLLEWICECKLKKVNLSKTMIQEQVKYLKELFKIFYNINMKMWNRIRSILGDLLYSNDSKEYIPFDIYAIFQKEGKRLLKAEIYEDFLERLDVKAIRSNSKKSLQRKSPKKKTKKSKEGKIENKDDDEVIAVEKPITIVDISNDDTEIYDKITKIKSEPLSPPYSVRQEVIKETKFLSKDIETTEREQTKEPSIKKEPQAIIKTEEDLINNLEEELNEFEEFIDIPENPTKTLSIDPDSETILETRIKIEPQECDNKNELESNTKLVLTGCNNKIVSPELDDNILQVELNKLNEFLGISNDLQTVSSNEKVEITKELDFDFINDNDSECIDIYQIVDNDEDNKEENGSSPKSLNEKVNFNEQNKEIVNGIRKKPIEIEFSDFDCLQIILRKNCDKSIKEILNGDNKTNKTAELIKKAEEENEETQIELDTEDADVESLQNKVEKNCKEENKTVDVMDKDEIELDIEDDDDVDDLQNKLEKNCEEEGNKTAEVMEEDEEENEETQIELEIEDCEEDVQNELREIIQKYAKENDDPLETTQQEEKRSPTEKDEDDYEIVLEIVSDEEDAATNVELNTVIDLLKSKEINENGKRSDSQTAVATSFLHTPHRKVARLNSYQSKDIISKVKDNNDVKSSNVKKRRKYRKRTF
ncbi:midasin-like [Lucilia cuprina]|uniref:midasin-like n=1 Tax=Lucilia cuprina TaxID=7375 RepID=UPI001F053BCA|nr:midasin-like [Lucilia cuprina]